MDINDFARATKDASISDEEVEKLFFGLSTTSDDTERVAATARVACIILDETRPELLQKIVTEVVEETGMPFYFLPPELADKYMPKEVVSER